MKRCPECRRDYYDDSCRTASTLKFSGSLARLCRDALVSAALERLLARACIVEDEFDYFGNT